MNKTTLITMTRGDSHKWFEKMLSSVPNNVDHKIITVKNDSHSLWAKKRLDSFLNVSTPYVAILDDDDLLLDNSISWCEQALENTNAGIAFTYEKIIDEEDNESGEVAKRQLKYFDIRAYPRAIHHLVVMRVEAIPRNVFEIQKRFGCGLEWYIKAMTALNSKFSGAIQIPKIGYGWRQRKGQYSRSDYWVNSFSHSFLALGNEIQKHMGDRSFENIPQFDI